MVEEKHYTQNVCKKKEQRKVGGWDNFDTKE